MGIRLTMFIGDRWTVSIIDRWTMAGVIDEQYQWVIDGQ